MVEGGDINATLINLDAAMALAIVCSVNDTLVPCHCPIKSSDYPNGHGGQRTAVVERGFAFAQRTCRFRITSKFKLIRLLCLCDLVEN